MEREKSPFKNRNKHGNKRKIFQHFAGHAEEI